MSIRRVNYIWAMVEKSLHDATKMWYSRPGDILEAPVDGYIIDIVRGDLLIEIQTGNFSAIRRKLSRLIREHSVRLVHPVSQQKWIVRLNVDGETVTSRRRSPKRGRVEDVFFELVYMPTLIRDQNLSLEVLLVHSEDVLIDDGRGSWRRRRWSIHDRRLIDVVNSRLFSEPADFRELLPTSLPDKFTTKELGEELRLRPIAAQKMVYCMRKMGTIESVGKRGRSLLYSVPR